ncbi:MAG: hypothetical protein HY266_02130 [Deltaproteobacteria bacterium]|nr:hypothetical protein [Deltaproteobacteria bacterium]
MGTKIFKLKEQVLQNMPAGELPHVVFGRLMLKSGILWALIREDTEVSQEQFHRALVAVEEVIGKRLIV